ncbi:hypothetical protein QTP70_005094 [Hemibagrus guttatus]|uniref:Uncharacterized protein n=1 Tax=Hemibagrus guttatus TaxID=175788 RepID=A0AAE0UPR3_9TELE|nr:hypothetical protein QTP70_005094 [Hemibagrus guttatus]
MRDEALTQYGHDFLHTVEKLLKECTEKREKAASQLHSLQQEQQQAVQTLHILQAQKKEVSKEKAQLQAARPGNAPETESPATRSGSAGKSTAAPKDPSTTEAEQRNRTIRRTLSVHVSRNSSSQERGVSQRPGREEDGLKRRSSFRNESKFEVLFGKLGRHVIRTKEDKDNPSCYQRSVQKPASLMVWGCMSACGMGSLHIWKGTINAERDADNLRGIFLNKLA